jgi:hypothetical protein
MRYLMAPRCSPDGRCWSEPGNVTDSLPHRIRSYWLSIGVKVQPGASTEELEAFERRYGVRLPDDVRAFLQVVNGFEEGEWDTEMVEWYSISRWAPMDAPAHQPSAASRLPDAACFVFADYCLDAFLYAIRLSPGPDQQNHVMGWAGLDPPSWQMANSFSELLEAYLRDPAVMLG